MQRGFEGLLREIAAAPRPIFVGQRLDHGQLSQSQHTLNAAWR